MTVALSACHRSTLLCRTEFLTPEYLAAEQINTPDPNRICYWGQQLVVRWNIARRCFTKPTDLVVTLRYGTRAIEVLTVPLSKASGFWVHRLINKDYWCQGGILSFKAELVQEGIVLTECRHMLWTDIIEIPPDELVAFKN